MFEDGKETEISENGEDSTKQKLSSDESVVEPENKQKNEMKDLSSDNENIAENIKNSGSEELSKEKGGLSEENDKVENSSEVPTQQFFEPECKRCKKKFFSPKTYIEHIESAGHKKKVIPPVKYECEVCEKVIVGKAGYDMHLRSKYHKKELFKYKLGEKFKEEKAKLPSKQESSARKGPIFSLRCEICNKKFSGLIPYDLHMSSASHNRMIEKATLDRLASCAVCNLTFSGLTSYELHMDSTLHMKNVKFARTASSSLLSQKGIVGVRFHNERRSHSYFSQQHTESSGHKVRKPYSVTQHPNAYPDREAKSHLFSRQSTFGRGYKVRTSSLTQKPNMGSGVEARSYSLLARRSTMDFGNKIKSSKTQQPNAFLGIGARKHSSSYRRSTVNSGHRTRTPSTTQRRVVRNTLQTKIPHPEIQQPIVSHKLFSEARTSSTLTNQAIKNHDLISRTFPSVTQQPVSHELFSEARTSNTLTDQAKNHGLISRTRPSVTQQPVVNFDLFDEALAGPSSVKRPIENTCLFNQSGDQSDEIYSFSDMFGFGE